MAGRLQRKEYMSMSRHAMFKIIDLASEGFKGKPLSEKNQIIFAENIEKILNTKQDEYDEKYDFNRDYCLTAEDINQAYEAIWK